LLTASSILEKNGINVTVDNAFVGENLQDQTTTDTTYNATTDFAGAGGFIGYYNVDDVWGDMAANVSASVNQSLAQYARKTAEASGDVLPREAFPHPARDDLQGQGCHL
jgi:hypothetical protein